MGWLDSAAIPLVGSRRGRRGLLKSRLNWRFALPLLTLGAVVALVTPSSATFPGPDGLISFARFSPKGNSADIHIARPDGSGVQKLTSNPRRFSLDSDWSPNGQLIAFDSNRVDVEGRKRADQIYLMGADGSGVTQLTRGAGFHGSPGWSPDGTRLAIEADWGDPCSTGNLDHFRVRPGRRHPSRGSAGNDDSQGRRRSTPSHSSLPTGAGSRSRGSRASRRESRPST